MRNSVGAHLSVATAGVLLVVSVALVVGLASYELRRGLASKRTAATMVTDLFTASVSPGVVFGDRDAITAEVANLCRTEAVLGASVLLADEHGDAVLCGSAAQDLASAHAPGVEVTDERMIVTRRILGRDSQPVGLARVAFSLAPEKHAQAETRRTLALGGFLVMVLTGAMLTVLTRRRVVGPLLRLVSVARRIELGDLGARADGRGRDELGTLARAFNSMGDAIAQRDWALREELQVAADLQVSILPRHGSFAGIEVSAIMQPATEVGGDYYDIIPTKDGCWIGIGDVSGHGLGAGVIMLMLQASIAALVRSQPRISPVDVVCTVNGVLFENIRVRMGRRDHATLSVVRYDSDGTLRFAGAHEDILVFRAATGAVESVETPGTWVGAIRDVRHAMTESRLNLSPGDVVVFYTDGITEAMRGTEQFGLERLIDVVSLAARGPIAELPSAVTDAVRAWTSVLADDVSLVALRCTAVDGLANEKSEETRN